MTTQAEGAGKPRPHHRTVDRVAAILEAVARHPEGVSLTDLAKPLGAPLSSLHGLANGLVATGYLEERNRRYRLGPAPFLLTRLAGTSSIGAVSHADLEEIQEATRMTTVLAIAVGSDVFYVDHATHNPRFTYYADNFVTRSLLHTSSGWILLAGMEQRDLRTHLNSASAGEEQLRERFLRALPGIRDSHLVVRPALTDEDTRGVATSVVVEGRTVAAVAVVGSEKRVAEREELIVETLLRMRERWAQG